MIGQRRPRAGSHSLHDNDLPARGSNAQQFFTRSCIRIDSNDLFLGQGSFRTCFMAFPSGQRKVMSAYIQLHDRRSSKLVPLESSFPEILFFTRLCCVLNCNIISCGSMWVTRLYRGAPTCGLALLAGCARHVIVAH